MPSAPAPYAPIRLRRTARTAALLLSALALLAVPTPAATPDAPRHESSLLRGPVTYTAHRGGALEVPENTMAGLTTTYRRGKAQVLDVDVRRLRDGTLVALHDRTLDRTTDARGPVDRLSLRQWRRVWTTPPRSLPGHWKPEHPPTVHRVLQRFGGRITLLLEIKDPRGLRTLSAMLHKRHLTRSVYVQSEYARVAAKAHRMGLLTSVWRGPGKIRTSRMERWAGKVDMLSVDHRARTRDVRRAVRSGIRRVWAHTVNSRAAKARMLRLGCTGIVTDAPNRLAR